MKNNSNAFKYYCKEVYKKLIKFRTMIEKKNYTIKIFTECSQEKLLKHK